ncbi:MAG: NAD-dependent epimerase/dehydratase family protein [Alphaproteobacteria bacterium]|nr:NAD-dependent epimerase/dehydratase family protein [Alphaproteobacteria bacterium]
MAGFDKASRVFIAGHRGLVGSAIHRALIAAGHRNIITRTRAELDLCDGAAVDEFFTAEKPEYVFLAAAKVGGIQANNTQPAAFIHDNLAIQINVIDAAWRHDAEKLLFLGSSCIYPKLAPQPIREEYLLTGELEPTNEAYAIAKIAGLKMCEAYRRQHGFNAIAVMPTNIYGPGDNFDLETGHVLPALIRKAHEAKVSGAAEMAVWGTGNPRREFLHVDDLADATLFCMSRYDDSIALNVGVGDDVTIRELVETVCDVVGFQGALAFDTSKPDGTPRKWLDVGRLAALGWRAKIGLRDGIASTYEWYLEQGGALAAE